MEYFHKPASDDDMKIYKSIADNYFKSIENARRSRLICSQSPYWKKLSPSSEDDKEILEKVRILREALEKSSREREEARKEQDRTNSMIREYQNLMKRIMRK